MTAKASASLQVHRMSKIAPVPCFYCRRPLNPRKVGNRQRRDDDPTIDHYIPLEIIPSFIVEWFKVNCITINNTVISGYKCNQWKKSSLPENWDGRMGPYQFTGTGWMWIGEAEAALSWIPRRPPAFKNGWNGKHAPLRQACP